jgi:membrane protease YdiL (CAAX protease family)
MGHEAAATATHIDRPLSPPQQGPWGFWATSGFSALAIVLFSVSRSLVSGPFRRSIKAENPGIDAQDLAGLLVQDGSYVSISTILGGAFGLALILLFAWLRRGVALRDYLALVRPEPGSLRTWLIVGASFIAASEGFKLLLGRGLVPDFALNVYASVRWPLLLWIAVVIVAPLFEELLFRGFLFAGWSRSRLGPMGTIVLTSLLWSAAHGQYELDFIFLIFAFGLVAGLARHHTGSLVVPIILHAAVNLVATIETIIISS